MRNPHTLLLPSHLLLVFSLAFPVFSCSRAVDKRPGESSPVAESSAGGQAQDSPGRPSGKRALLVGINSYKHGDRIPPLAGSFNDVENMKAVLIGKFEFPPENVLVLKGEQATHTGIINAIRDHLIAKARKDDIVVFHYSGHGSQMKDVTGNEISGLVETIVPYDSRDPAGQVFDISGSELHGLLLQLAAKTRNITFILDSCHSGTLVRGARARNIAPDTRTPPQLPDYAVQTRSLGAVEEGATPKYVLIAAATSRESAYEHVSEGKEHGALTYFLARQLRNAGAGVTYRDIMDNVRGNVTAVFPVQHPQLEGAQIDQYVFGDSGSLAESYVIASPKDASKMSLAIGEAQGATVDSIYDVFKPGTKKFVPPEGPIGRVQITSTGPFESEGKLISGSNIPQFSRAIEREHRYGSSRLNIHFDRPDSSIKLQSIKSAAASLPYLQVVTDPAISNLRVREVDGKVLTLAPDGTALSPPIPANDPEVIRRSVQRIKDWARWFNILSIVNTQPSVSVEFSIMAGQKRDALSQIGKSDMSIGEGDVVEAVVKNTSTRDLYISILDLSSDGSIAVAYPPDQGASEVLQPGKPVTIKLKGSVPSGLSSVTDILKVFASSHPIDLTPLTRAPIRSVSDGADPLQALLENVVSGRRSVVVVKLGDWTTAQRVIAVKRKK